MSTLGLQNILPEIGKGIGSLTSGIAEGTGANINYQASLDPNVLAQQQAFIQALQQQSQGLGPNLAQAQLRQATSEAQQRAAGMAASQKGISPALAQRMALQNQAAMQQQAAGQSGLMAAQQQLGTQELLGRQLAQQQQQRLGMQGLQTGIEQENARTRAGIAGGLIGGIGGGLTATAKNMADGGMVQQPQVQSPIVRNILGLSPLMAAQGALVPGHAEVAGDSYANDKVSAILSPGEIVLPRSVTMSDNAPNKAANFVKKTLENESNLKEQYADGGQVPFYLSPTVQEQTPAMPQFVGPDILQQPVSSVAQQMPTTPAAQSTYDKVIADVAERNRKLLEGDFGPSMYMQAVKGAQAMGEALTPKSVSPELASQLGIQIPQKPAMGLPSISEQTMPVQDTGMTTQQMPQLGQPQQAMLDPFGYGKQLAALQEGLKLQKAGISGEAAAMGALGKAQANIYEQAQKTLGERQANFEKNTLDVRNLIDQTNKDIKEAKIDPNKYLGDLSTIGKASTVLGLIFGGIGGGLQRTGQNVALDTLNKLIDRDISAQKANLDKKTSLLSSYYHQLGDMRTAENMARATMLEQFSDQLKSEAAKSQDPMAKARANQALGQLQMQTAQIVAQTGARQTMMGVAEGKQVDPALIIRAMVPENQQKEYYNELKNMQNTVKSRDNILSAFNKIEKLATIPSYLSSPINTTRQIKAITEPLTALLSKETAGRFTEQDAKMLETLWPQVGDDEKTLSTKKQQIEKLISEKMHFPMLIPYQIYPEQFSRYSFGKGGEKAIKLGKPVLKGQ